VLADGPGRTHGEWWRREGEVWAVGEAPLPLLAAADERAASLSVEGLEPEVVLRSPTDERELPSQFRSIAIVSRACELRIMPLSPADFGRMIAKCWSQDTASIYSPTNPARGQCSVTALVAQDHLGGTIAKTRIGGAWHFYNLVDHRPFDFTAGQFDQPVSYEDTPSSRDDALTDTALEQYRALSDAFRKAR
jgi:hypothetical protein